MITRLSTALIVSFVAASAGVARAQSAAAPPEAASAGAAVSAAAAQPSDDAAALDLAEPDFYVVNVPTTMRLPLRKGNFRLTHRFGSNLRSGDFGDQAGNLFGLDSGAVIGLEYRYAVMPRLQAVILRSSFDKTFQFSGKYDAIHQSADRLISVSGVVAVEGGNNFQERYAPALGAVIGHEVKDRLAVYAAPVWVHNSAALTGTDRDTLVLGLGGRARIGATVYVVSEVSPRLAGYAPGDVEYGFGVEKRAGAHVFQLTFANAFGTTYGALARGGNPEALYLGFNLTRKFF